MLDEVSSFRENNTLFSYIYPAQNEDIVKQLAARKATVFGMECVPRISRAQVFDALSSMANISGYKAVVLAANNFGRFFTGAFVDAMNVGPHFALIDTLGNGRVARLFTRRGPFLNLRSVLFTGDLNVKNRITN